MNRWIKRKVIEGRCKVVVKVSFHSNAAGMIFACVPNTQYSFRPVMTVGHRIIEWQFLLGNPPTLDSV